MIKFLCALLLVSCAIGTARAAEEGAAEAETYAGKFSWSRKGGERGGHKGPVSCTLTRAEDGSCAIAWNSKYQGKTYAYAGTVAPSADNEKLLVGTAMMKQGKKKSGYHIMLAISSVGELRGKAFMGKKKDGSFKDQIAIFTLKKK